MIEDEDKQNYCLNGVRGKNGENCCFCTIECTSQDKQPSPFCQAALILKLSIIHNFQSLHLAIYQDNPFLYLWHQESCYVSKSVWDPIECSRPGENNEKTNFMQRPVWCKVDEVLYITGHCAPIEGKGEHQDRNCSHLKMTKLGIKRFHPCMVAPSSSPSVHGSTCSSGVSRNDNPIIPAAGKRKARLAITCNHRSKLLSLPPLQDYALGCSWSCSVQKSNPFNPIQSGELLWVF